MSTAHQERAAASQETITITYRDAMRAAIKDAIERDDRVFLMGEDVGMYGGWVCSDAKACWPNSDRTRSWTPRYQNRHLLVPESVRRCAGCDRSSRS